MGFGFWIELRASNGVRQEMEMPAKSRNVDKNLFGYGNEKILFHGFDAL